MRDPRGQLAARDDQINVSDVFGCALAVRPTPQTAPRLTYLLARISRDTGVAQSRAKDAFQRRRPYQRWGGEICVPRTPSMDNSLDYPSGHATLGWAWGLVLADLAPDRRAAILARARAFGESRAVCGMHTASAVEAARTLGDAVVAAERANPAFRTDLEAARMELAALRRTPGSAPPPAACRAEQAVIARPAYSR